ncbi:MAG: ATP-binding protein, partial [Thermomicrobiales bacterium]
MKRTLVSMRPADTPDTLSARDAALVLGVHERTVRRAIARGELPAVKRGGVFQIARDDLRQFRIPARLLTPAFAKRSEPPRLLPVPDRDARPEQALPRPRTPLIGRSDDIAQIKQRFQSEGERHVTLTGAGGVGKSRLSIQVASELIPSYPDGVWFIPFAPVRDPSLFGPTIVRALGIVEQNDRPVVQILSSVIRNRRMLLILDNLEHLLAETGLITALLAACPNLAILATSRTRLNVSGEHEHHVVPLALPPQSSNTGRPSWVETAGNATAVQLFVDRARAMDSTFELTIENAGAVAAIVAAVDGLPLAIELVAAQTRLFSPAELLKRMGRRLPLLTGGPRDLPKRHQTMADAIAWSYDLLSVDEQMLFRRLSVFVGGCTLEAAEAVADFCEQSSILGMISSLVDHQLLIVIGPPNRPTRFTMLETIREYAGERLAESGERAACDQRHAIFFLALAEQYQLGEVMPEGESAVALLDTEQANVRAALTWLEASSKVETFLQLAGALGIYWSGQGMYQEGRYWLERALSRASPMRFEDRARV